MLKNQRHGANTVDPDETAHYETPHLDLQCLQIQLALYRITVFFVSFRMSGLHQAALMGNTEIMEVLLDNGADVRLRDNKGKLTGEGRGRGSGRGSPRQWGRCPSQR